MRNFTGIVIWLGDAQTQHYRLLQPLTIYPLHDMFSRKDGMLVQLGYKEPSWRNPSNALRRTPKPFVLDLATPLIVHGVSQEPWRALLWPQLAHVQDEAFIVFDGFNDLSGYAEANILAKAISSREFVIDTALETGVTRTLPGYYDDRKRVVVRATPAGAVTKVLQPEGIQIVVPEIRTVASNAGALYVMGPIYSRLRDDYRPSFHRYMESVTQALENMPGRRVSIFLVVSWADESYLSWLPRLMTLSHVSLVMFVCEAEAAECAVVLRRLPPHNLVTRKNHGLKLGLRGKKPFELVTFHPANGDRPFDLEISDHMHQAFKARNSDPHRTDILKSPVNVLSYPAAEWV